MIKKNVLLLIGIFFLLPIYVCGYGHYYTRIYKGKVDKYVKVFEKIADSLESTHLFSTDPDSTDILKGFVLSINKDKKSRKIIVSAHKFNESHFMIAFGALLEEYYSKVNPIICKRDSIYYLFWGNNSALFASSLGEEADDLIEKEKKASNITYDKAERLHEEFMQTLPPEDRYEFGPVISEAREFKMLKDAKFIEFELTPIYSTERGRRNEIIDWKLK